LREDNLILAQLKCLWDVSGKKTLILAWELTCACILDNNSYNFTQKGERMFKIKPCLWFDNNAEEAANLYVSIFKNSRILKISHYTEAGPLPAGTVLVVEFQIEGQEFLALNGGPEFHFSEAISFSVDVETQEELDDLWHRLSAGGQEGPCGWLKDRYGLSWQIVPTVLSELMSGADPVKAAKVTAALFKMGKLDIAALKAAAEN
jgi:predicted 3-demethylubiquinone-9 3-methyltransferase (glyoxalase superfamily)